MPIKNMYKIEPERGPCHDGEGIVNMTAVYDGAELDSALKFFHYTVLPPGASIGLHNHGNDEEFYIILEGTGVMEVDGQKTPVGPGDAVLNKPFGAHALYNTSESADLKILVFEADAPVK